jgi:FtsZ-interacting cell division protein ZipA
MKRVLIITAALAALAVPLTGVAAAKTSKADKREARQECRALRGDTAASREAFKAQFHSFGKCVKEKAHEAKAERKKAHRNAARDCRDERTADPDAFKTTYKNFGKCVSQKAKAKREQQDEDDAQEAEDQSNAAQECASERSADRKAFEDKYGTNHNKKNAFGKCVSQKVHEAGDDDTEGEDGGS